MPTRLDFPGPSLSGDPSQCIMRRRRAHREVDEHHSYLVARIPSPLECDRNGHRQVGRHRFAGLHERGSVPCRGDRKDHVVHRGWDAVGGSRNAPEICIREDHTVATAAFAQEHSPRDTAGGQRLNRAPQSVQRVPKTVAR